MICHLPIYNHGSKFEDTVCNRCHNLTVSSVDISDIAFIAMLNAFIINVDYRFIIHSICKSEAINLLESSVLENRGYT